MLCNLNNHNVGFVRPMECTVCIKNGTVRFFFSNMKFVPTVCVLFLSKRNKCSFCSYLNHLFCICKSRVMPRFMR